MGENVTISALNKSSILFIKKTNSLLILKLFNNLRDSKSVESEEENQLLLCILLGALCSKSVPNIFLVDFKLSIVSKGENRSRKRKLITR